MGASIRPRAPTAADRQIGRQEPAWWTFTTRTAIGGQITNAETDNLALALQDVARRRRRTTSGLPIVNGSTRVPQPVDGTDYAGLANAVDEFALQPMLFSDYMTDKADLASCATSAAR